MPDIYPAVARANVNRFLFSLLVQLVYQRSIFLDKFLVWMEEQGASFVSVAFIVLLTLYMIIATLKGIFFVS